MTFFEIRVKKSKFSIFSLLMILSIHLTLSLEQQLRPFCLVINLSRKKWKNEVFVKKINLRDNNIWFKKLNWNGKFFSNFKGGSGNIACVTGKWNFDQLEIKDNWSQICKDITILCIQSHFIDDRIWLKIDQNSIFT